MTRVALGLGGNVPVRQAVEFARYAETQRFDSCWMHEASWTRDALISLTAMALSTRRLKLATGCINPHTRHPVLIASSLAALDELSGGRVTLGFGTGDPSRLDAQGIPHSRPISAMRESITLIRRLWQGEKVTYIGRAFRLTNVALSVRPPRPIPIYLAGRGPRMLQLAGEMCDGYLARAVESPTSCRRLIGVVRRAAEAGGRSEDTVDAAAYLLCAVARNREAARSAMRRDPFALSQFAVIPNDVLAESGVDPASRRPIADAVSRGDIEGAARQIGNEFVDTLTLAGTADDVLERLAAYARAGVRCPILLPIAAEPRDVERVIDVGREYAQSEPAVVSAP